VRAKLDLQCGAKGHLACSRFRSAARKRRHALFSRHCDLSRKAKVVMPPGEAAPLSSLPPMAAKYLCGASLGDFSPSSRDELPECRLTPGVHSAWEE